MKLDPAEVWTSQKPPADFADRVMHAFAEERVARLPSPVARSTTRRSAVLLAAAAAAVLVLGSAWAAWRQRDGRPPVQVVAAPAAPVQVVTAPAIADVQTAAPPLAPVVSATPRPRPRPVAPAPPAASSASAAPRKVIVPPCICHDIACDCGPEP